MMATADVQGPLIYSLDQVLAGGASEAAVGSFSSSFFGSSAGGGAAAFFAGFFCRAANIASASEATSAPGCKGGE